VKQLHDNGYQFTGDTSFYGLTLPEVRVLLEGSNTQEERKARDSGQTTGSGPHERAPGQTRQSDEAWVAKLDSQSD
jgi:hypothetical protein